MDSKTNLSLDLAMWNKAKENTGAERERIDAWVVNWSFVTVEVVVDIDP
jgi:hypothetical protein